MTSFHKYFCIYLSLWAGALSYEIDINGEFSFDMRISGGHFDRATDMKKPNLKSPKVFPESSEAKWLESDEIKSEFDTDKITYKSDDRKPSKAPNLAEKIDMEILKRHRVYETKSGITKGLDKRNSNKRHKSSEESDDILSLLSHKIINEMDEVKPSFSHKIIKKIDGTKATKIYKETGKLNEGNNQSEIEKKTLKDSKKDKKVNAAHREAKVSSELDEQNLKEFEKNRDDQEDIGRGITAAAVVECLYQYPDVEQFNAMLSNMMNELTKVFVRVHKMIKKKDGRRRQETRFVVVDKRETTFFEDIYANMTKEYRQFYNTTTIRVARAADDPCKNQEELKDVWRELLERSMNTLRHAALSCVEKLLRSKNRSEDLKTRHKLEQYLFREMTRIRSRQLHMLCDSFQLCYNDLL